MCRRDSLCGLSSLPVVISIHAPHAGRDVIGALGRGRKRGFQSTRPMRGATYLPRKYAAEVDAFQSTRPMRGATRRDEAAGHADCISIHAPHAGRDERPPQEHTSLQSISIHAPHAGRDVDVHLRAAAHSSISIHAPHAGRDYSASRAALMEA